MPYPGWGGPALTDEEITMFGTREALCRELESMFTPEEPLLLLVWTPGSLEAACDPEEEGVSEEELPALMAALGDIPMDTYQETPDSHARNIRPVGFFSQTSEL